MDGSRSRKVSIRLVQGQIAWFGSFRIQINLIEPGFQPSANDQ